MRHPIRWEFGAARFGGADDIKPAVNLDEAGGQRSRDGVSLTVPSRSLVVTADDFGAAVEVNEAIEIANREGVLTAASLMVGAPAFADAVSRARGLSRLRVGLHVVLVDGRPVLPARDVPALVDREGRFASDMVRAGVTMFFRPDARRQLEAEINAQFDAFAATGLPLDHVNAHKHFHLHPTIAGLILKAGRRHGLSAIRAPSEPARALLAADPASEIRMEPLVDLWSRLARARFRRAGLRVPDQVFGLRWSGSMTPARLLGLIRTLPLGLSEIYLHPATQGGFEGAAPGYQYATELAALTSPAVRLAVSRSGVALGGYSDFRHAARVIG